MTSMLRTCLAATLAWTLAASALPAAAATGIAYESITKFAISQDASAPAPAPGTFGADFAAATSDASTSGDVPKMPFGLGKMMAKANAAISSLKNGMAEKHYVGVTKERVDEIAAKTGEITDCNARTITHLDFDKKTYYVESLDHPETVATPGSSRHAAPQPAATDDGTKIAIVVTTKSLGAMNIEGVPTTGYDMDIKMTATKPTGESATSTMNMLSYFSSIAEPHFGCASRYVPAASGMPPGAAAGMQNYAMLMRAMSASKGDSRFTVTNSGPAIPAGKLAMWQDMKMVMSGTDHSTGQRGQAGFAVITERGAIKAPLADSDPAFEIPAGFTKVSG